jgi:hypothetical protein
MLLKFISAPSSLNLANHSGLGGGVHTARLSNASIRLPLLVYFLKGLLPEQTIQPNGRKGKGHFGGATTKGRAQKTALPEESAVGV